MPFKCWKSYKLGDQKSSIGVFTEVSFVQVIQWQSFFNLLKAGSEVSCSLL